MNAQQRDVIERLYRDHARGVGRYVLARVGDAELAELIVSRVYERVVDRIGQCRGEPAAWLWAIARTELALHYRTRRRHSEVNEEIADGCATPAEHAEGREMTARIGKVMEMLPERERELIEMKFFRDMPNVEVAAATGLSASNVGVLVHRAIRRLRELMGQPAEEKSS